MLACTAIGLLASFVPPSPSLVLPTASPARLHGHGSVVPAARTARLGIAPCLCSESAKKEPPILSPEFTIYVGLALLLVLVGNRLFTEELLNSQSRADLIATIGPTVLILEGLTRLDITPKEAEPVPLDGSNVAWVAPGLEPALTSQLEWSTEALISCLPASSVAIVSDGATVALRGTLPASVTGAPPGQAVVPGPLLSKCLNSKSGAPDYLPSLQILPGRFEFTYLPAATQTLLLVPVPPNGALIIGSDTARAFKEDDIAWARTMAAGLAQIGADAVA